MALKRYKEVDVKSTQKIGILAILQWRGIVNTKNYKEDRFYTIKLTK